MDASHIHIADLAIIVLYFIGVVWLAVWVSRKKIDGGEDYFLAGRQMTWPFVGASLFSTNISSQQFVGQAGFAFVSGIAVGTFQVVGGICFGLLAVFFLETYRGLKLYTSPEFFERRYNATSRSLISLVNVIMIMLATVSAALYSGSVVFLTIIGRNPDTSLHWLLVAVIVLGAITGAYTLLGGLKAVIYTDFVQNILLILGGIITLFVGIAKAGGLQAVLAMKTTSGGTMWSLVHPVNHNFGWLPVMTGVIILGIHGHCTDQDFVQRALAAKNTFHAKMGAVFAGILKVVALFICVVPGIIAAKLFQDMNIVIDHDQAYARLMMEVLPIGLLGLCLAGLLAAIMSSVDSGLCAASSLLTCDFIAKRHDKLDQKRMLKLGRWIILILLVFSILWAPNITKFKGLFEYLMLIWSLMAPPVVVCVLCGLFYKRANGKAAISTLATGILLGILGFLILQKPAIINSIAARIGFTDFSVTENLHWYFLNKFNISFLITIFCLITMIVVSKFTKQTEDDLKKSEEIQKARASKEDDMTAKEKRIYYATMALLIILSVAVVIFFSPIGIAR
ncbi:sodium/solute symporter [Verrucomicrobiota bacterium]